MFFLALIVVLSLALYIRRLGFYYDDYTLLGTLRTSHNQSLGGLYHALSSGVTQKRPLQTLTLAALYRVFDSRPLGYHIFNAAVFAIAVVLFALVLRELLLPRVAVVSIPLIYATLPHYATDRYWVASFVAMLSIALFFLSLYSALRAASASRAAAAAWGTTSVVALIASALAYEVALPLFALGLALICWRQARTRGVPVLRSRPEPRVLALVSVLVVALIGALTMKALLVARIGSASSYHVGFGSGFPHHLAYLVEGSIKLNVGTYGIALPYVLWWCLRNEFSLATMLISAAAALAVFVYLWLIMRRNEADVSGTRWIPISKVGVVAFVLGYAIFLTNEKILFRSAGIDNRVNIAAAVGVAGVIVGAIGWLASRLGGRRGRALFCFAVAALVGVNLIIVNTLASFWTEAYARQRTVLHGLTRTLEAHPRPLRLLLDGVCPEIGPAPVFANPYDLTGALTLRYGSAAPEAVPLTAEVLPTQRGVTVVGRFLGRRDDFGTYRYGPRLAVFDDRNGQTYRLTNRRAARRYLGRIRSPYKCPPVRSFAWGFKISRWQPFL